jgi:hypothetical protein
LYKRQARITADLVDDYLGVGVVGRRGTTA